MLSKHMKGKGNIEARTKIEELSNNAYGGLRSQIHSTQKGDEKRREELYVKIHPYLQFSTYESRGAAHKLLRGIKLSWGWIRPVLCVRI